MELDTINKIISINKISQEGKILILASVLSTKEIFFMVQIYLKNRNIIAF